MALEQGQHAAQGGHSADSSPQAVRPILKPINPAHHALKEYRISCDIDSVRYYADGEYTRCAVVLNVGFLMSGMDFDHAIFPTRVQNKYLDRFPEVDEVVDISEYTVQRTFIPHIQAGGEEVAQGAVHQRIDRMAKGLLHLRPQRASHEEIWWRFINEKSDYFPSSVQLLLVVQGQESPRFSFKLEVLPILEVHIKRRRWRSRSTILQPGVHDGWSCLIENDYRPVIAEGILTEYQKPREQRKHSQMVGLHSAMISYSGETRVPVDSKIEPILIPSAAIKKLQPYVHDSGGFGDIWKCSMSTQSGVCPVAVKSIRIWSNDVELLRKAGRRIRREAYSWIQLSHNHILRLEGIVDDFGKLPALVSLWMENGSLNDFLKRSFPQLSDGRKLELVQQVAAGLSYLHGKDVVHGDLTGTNILVDDSGNLRLADYGLSMIIAESGDLIFGSGQPRSMRWMAPEFLDYPEEYEAPLKPTKSGDIYSFGCVMLQIFSGEEPYPRMKVAVQIINAILSGREPFRGVKMNLKEVHSLLSSRCLSKVPEGRPTIVEITTTLDL